MSQKLTVNGFKWGKNTSKYNEKFIKNYDEDSNRADILEVDLEYLKNLHDLHSDLPLLPERMRINKCSKLVCNLYDKKMCCTYNKQIFHTFLFNMRNYSPEIINI